MTTKIILADDHVMFRQGLAVMLNEHPDMDVIGEAEDGATIIKLSLELKPDLVVMDVSMPGINGIDAARKIIPQLPNIKIIALSTYLKKAFIIEMLKAGASGYVLKEQAFDELVEAINTVMSGETYLSSKASSILVDDYIQMYNGRSQPEQQGLTPREYEVLKLLAEGKTSKEIAMLSNISVQAVDAIRRRLMQKLNIANFADLIKYAIRKGLTSLGQ